MTLPKVFAPGKDASPLPDSQKVTDSLTERLLDRFSDMLQSAFSHPITIIFLLTLPPPVCSLTPTYPALRADELTVVPFISVDGVFWNVWVVLQIECLTSMKSRSAKTAKKNTDIFLP